MKLIAVGLFTLATGCAVESAPTSTPTEPVAPRISVLLTDAPGDYEAVWVNIASVAIESADTGWMTVTDTPQRFDLLQLQNDVTAALGGTTLAAGTYGQLRLIVDSASVVVAGEESEMKIASGMQTGIKVILDRELEDNMTYAITLDYDADKSVKQTGQGYLMTPVIKVKDVVATPVETEEEGDEAEPIL
jgi:hypothetical protein